MFWYAAPNEASPLGASQACARAVELETSALAATNRTIRRAVSMGESGSHLPAPGPRAIGAARHGVVDHGQHLVVLLRGSDEAAVLFLGRGPFGLGRVVHDRHERGFRLRAGRV